ncbi:unnamed protein product [Gongylonema pulchrum]|uniref:Uncharacterized protein n=1 Tax=Gongylonema pulchrum TaxID=637853 RepID=A0A183EXV0_9BILA|nr:unnamed protein product [Gongylonema pulchrum]
MFQLLRLLTQSAQSFEDNFIDRPLPVSYLQLKLAPQRVAVVSSELIALLEADQLEREERVAGQTPDQSTQVTSL